MIHYVQKYDDMEQTSFSTGKEPVAGKQDEGLIAAIAVLSVATALLIIGIISWTILQKR